MQQLSETVIAVLHALYFYDDVDFKLLKVDFKLAPTRPVKTMNGWIDICPVDSETARKILLKLKDMKVLEEKGRTNCNRWILYAINYNLIKKLCEDSSLGKIVKASERYW